MIFSKCGTPKHHLKKFNLNINKNHIEKVTLFKYLGVYLDYKLSWNEHIQNLQTKLSKFSGLVYRLRQFVPKSIILMLYNALVGSYIRYGILSWGSCPQNQKQRLQSTQNKIIRNLDFLSPTAHIDEQYYGRLKIFNIENVYIHEVIKLIHSIYHKYNPPAFQDFLQPSRHTYSTRLKENSCFSLSKPRTEFGKRSLKFSGVKLWTGIKNSVKDIPEYNKFNKAYKTNYFSTF